MCVLLHCEGDFMFLFITQCWVFTGAVLNLLPASSEFSFTHYMFPLSMSAGRETHLLPVLFQNCLFRIK